jgi:hypothetical protein
MKVHGKIDIGKELVGRKEISWDCLTSPGNENAEDHGRGIAILGGSTKAQALENLLEAQRIFIAFILNGCVVVPSVDERDDDQFRV